MKPSRSYRRVDRPAYTRKKFIGRMPDSMIKKFHLGNTKKDFPLKIRFIVQKDGQIADSALESVRINLNRRLERKIGPDNYNFHIHPIPHHFSREHGITMAKAERYVKGMRFCQFPSSLVFCKDKIKEAQELIKGDYILSEGYFTQVLGVQEIDYNGFLYKIKVRGCPHQIFTAEHPFLIRRLSKYKTDIHYARQYNRNAFFSEKIIWLKAENLKVNDFVVFKKLPYQDYSFLDKDFLDLMGWYLGEGSTYFIHKRGYISLALSNDDPISHVQNLLLEQGIKSRIKDKGTSKEIISLVSKETDGLVQFLRDNFGLKSFVKKMPLFMNESNLKYWLPSYIKADGSKYSNGMTMIKTSSPFIALRLYLMLLNMGYKTFLTTYPEKEIFFGKVKSFRKKGFGIFTSFPSRKRKLGFELKNEIWLRVKNIERILYEGKVIGILTENNLYSLPYVTHNSFGKVNRCFARVKKGQTIITIGIEDEKHIKIVKNLLRIAANKLPFNYKIVID